MAASRKLQGEIDRCLKKVAEGVEQFEDIWQKVHNATNSNQKEKYEADLKKEIKKLQRLRDQIKSWLASGEIKDKSQLLENRKLIETQMERFKVVERETKTKAYSKEGLGAAQNKDPAQREREEVNNWLSSSIDTLNIQMDQFESEIESLLATQKKKKMDKDKSDRIEDLKEYIDRHQYHIKKLEILMRMLDNQSIDCDQIKMIKEDVEYYIESSQDPDFSENVGLYDDIDMDDLDYPTPEITHVLGGSHDSTDGSTPSSVCGSSPAPSPATNHSNDHDAPTTPHDKKRSSKNEESRSVSSTSQPVKPLVVRPTTNSITSNSNLSSNSSSNTNNSSSVSTASIVVVNSNSSSKATPPPSTPTKPVSGSTSQTTPNNSSTSSGTSNHLITSASQHNSTGRHSPEPSGLINSGIVNSNSGSGSSSSSSSSCSNSSSSSGNSVSNSSGSSSSSSSSSSNGLSSGVSSSVSVTSPQGSLAGSATTTPALPTPSTPSTHQVHTPTMNAADTAVSLKAIAQKKVNEVNSTSIPPSVLDGSSCVVSSSSTTTSTNTNSNNNSTCTNSSGKSTGTCEAHIPPLLGVAPLGPAQLTVEHELQFKMLQAAFFHMPHPSDSERLRIHLPRQPCQTPLYYPQVSGLDLPVSPPMSDTVDFFQRLSTETLFFIFYYMEGTKAQYLAAKALKKQSWRFHTKYMMWFQRHEEPKAITDEYEQAVPELRTPDLRTPTLTNGIPIYSSQKSGTYIYFDYENWGQRKKENFTFEYRFLEDRDLN
ncbi:CCR4-NOT transcription complex subunit 3-like isoform X3 [Homarus americanus]|uniref:CCR4-NOT transcription complex subunit 3-like isoform X3 n=1 Tax=Homarus americanus TaxID=6706 RepID=UPI001C48D479|nr:CCR4-NOT transcription complex subunit 3-like isoform X3 [Homarus americanus]